MEPTSSTTDERRPLLVPALRSIRADVNLQQKVIAARMGMGQTTVGGWFTKTDPDVRTLVQLADAMGVTVERILRRAGLVGSEVDVLAAIDADPKIDASWKATLKSIYEKALASSETPE